MKKLVLSALLLATVSQAAGCIIVSDDDDTGNASVTWSTLTADANGNGVATGCPAGANRAIIYALPDGQTGDPYEDRYLCADTGGVATDLPAGRYTMWVRLTDDAFVTRFAESGSQVVDVPSGGTVNVPNFGIFVDHAFLDVSWTLNVPGSGAGGVQCSNVQTLAGVSVDATDSGGMLFDSFFQCAEGLSPAIAETRPVPVGGQYTVAVAALNAQNSPIGTAPALTPNDVGPVQYGNQYIDLGVVSINNWP